MKSEQERFWEKVQKTSSCWIWIGANNKDGYGAFWVGGRSVKPHRYSFEQHNGPIPAGMLLDHKCFVRACVNPSHLRIVTPKQNAEHKQAARKDNTSSGVRGVSSNGNQWRARVCSNGKSFYLGNYASILEAEHAVIEARSTLFTHDDYKEWSKSNG